MLTETGRIPLSASEPMRLRWRSGVHQMRPVDAPCALPTWPPEDCS